MSDKKEDNKAVCPICVHEFDFEETFAWVSDEHGHPTIESLYCPKCGIATYKTFSCDVCPGGTKGSRFECSKDEECPACATVNYEEFFNINTLTEV